jgi:hypothetical protein
VGCSPHDAQAVFQLFFPKNRRQCKFESARNESPILLPENHGIVREEFRKMLELGNDIELIRCVKPT